MGCTRRGWRSEGVESPLVPIAPLLYYVRTIVIQIKSGAIEVGIIFECLYVNCSVQGATNGRGIAPESRDQAHDEQPLPNGVTLPLIELDHRIP